MPVTKPKKPESFQRFEDAMRHIVKVPKAEVDAAVKKFHAKHKRKKSKK